MVVALFFAERRSATNLSITISATLLSLNSLTRDYKWLLVSFSVSSIHIIWMFENTLFISQFCSSSSSSSSRAVNYNKSIHLTFASSMFLLSSFCLCFDAIISYSLFSQCTKTVWYKVRYTANQGLLS